MLSIAIEAYLHILAWRRLHCKERARLFRASVPMVDVPVDLAVTADAGMVSVTDLVVGIDVGMDFGIGLVVAIAVAMDLVAIGPLCGMLRDTLCGTLRAQHFAVPPRAYAALFASADGGAGDASADQFTNAARVLHASNVV